MSFSIVVVYVHLLFITFQSVSPIVCPPSYILVANACYQVNNKINLTWSDAQQFCTNDSQIISTNKSIYVTHLVALESDIETRSLVFWMKALNLRGQFWTDGVASSMSWNWSNQLITWHSNLKGSPVRRDGSFYKVVIDIANDNDSFQSDLGSEASAFLCEYQERCTNNNSCLNNATCYLNFGRELCICAPGFTGSKCGEQIDECLSSPCQHGGKCIDGSNNYTCDCSNIFFHGPNCDIVDDDPTQNQRSAAFWSVFGVVCSLVLLLTLSDLPWSEIYSHIGCPWCRFKCCSDDDEDDEDKINTSHLHVTESPTNEGNLTSNQTIMPTVLAGGTNYRVLNTIWNPEHFPFENSSNLQRNGSNLPDKSKTPNNALIKSFASVFIAKQKEKDSIDKHVYAVDIVENKTTTEAPKNPLDTMVTWTQQLQEQLKSKQSHPASASSTKELIQLHDRHES